MLTSLWVSSAKSRAHREEEKEEEEASNRAPPPLLDIEMQDPLQDEWAAQAVTEAREVPAIEVVRIQAESSERAGALPAEEEEEAKDGSLGGHLVEATKVTHEWVEVGPFLSLYVDDLLLLMLSCDAELFCRLWWRCLNRPPRS